MGIEQHFMALAGVGHQPEGAAGAQFHVSHLHAVIDATNHHAFFAPVELKCLAQLKLQGHEGFDVFACAGAPLTDVVGDAAVAACVAAGLDLLKQGFAATTLLSVAPSVSLEGLFQLGNETAKLAISPSPLVARTLALLH
mgnify:CR=1 FL=1